MLIFLIIFLLFTLFLLFIITSSFFGFLITRVPFVPTPAKDIRELALRLPINSTDFVYELGSGNGKVAFLIEENTDARVLGFEATLWTHLWASIKKRIKRSKSQFIYGDFYKHPWTDASIIYMYLYPPLMPFIAEKALQDCKPGTKIVSRDFPNRHLNQIDEYKTASGHMMYIYQIS